MADDLYDQDFHLWTVAQAQALRARGQGSNTIDWEQVAEEVEDMGKRELHACESPIVRIIEHLHKLRAATVDEPRRHRRKEIAAFRVQVARRLTPSIRLKIDAELEQLHEGGALEAERWLDHDDTSFDPIDRARRWSLAEILGETDDPVSTRHWTEV